MKIANNGSKLGMVRHLEIRYHLVRCIVLSGNIILSYCITEEMLADLFTKIVTSAQDKRLAVGGSVLQRLHHGGGLMILCCWNTYWTYFCDCLCK
jgi:hypothetical protein